jgi:hypothetical protein
VIPRFWGVRVGRCPSWKIVTTRPEFACCAALGRNVPGWVLSCPVRRQRVGRGLRLSVTGLAGSRDLDVSSAVVALDHRVLSGGTALAVGRHRLQESTVTRRRAKMPWTSPGTEPLVMCQDAEWTLEHRHWRSQ